MNLLVVCLLAVGCLCAPSDKTGPSTTDPTILPTTTEPNTSLISSLNVTTRPTITTLPATKPASTTLQNTRPSSIALKDTRPVSTTLQDTTNLSTTSQDTKPTNTTSQNTRPASTTSLSFSPTSTASPSLSPTGSNSSSISEVSTSQYFAIAPGSNGVASKPLTSTDSSKSVFYSTSQNFNPGRPNGSPSMGKFFMNQSSLPFLSPSSIWAANQKMMEAMRNRNQQALLAANQQEQTNMKYINGVSSSIQNAAKANEMAIQNSFRTIFAPFTAWRPQPFFRWQQPAPLWPPGI